MSYADANQSQTHALYVEHRSWLFGWLRRKLGNVCHAEDVLHDTFVRLMVRPRTLDEGRNPRAYLSTIAHGLVIDHWRRQEIERVWLEALATRVDAVAPSAEHTAMVVQALMEIDRVLSALGDKPRRAFLLAQIYGLGYAAIGTELGVSERMIKKYMAQAMLHCLKSDAILARA